MPNATVSKPSSEATSEVTGRPLELLCWGDGLMFPGWGPRFNLLLALGRMGHLSKVLE